MRFVVAALMGLGLLGCASPSPQGPLPRVGESRPFIDQTVQGKVVEANPALRYVVLDFPVRGLPALDQRLSVYRDGQKVGEVAVSGPYIGTAVAADVVAGQAEIGDAVRAD